MIKKILFFAVLLFLFPRVMSGQCQEKVADHDSVAVVTQEVADRDSLTMPLSLPLASPLFYMPAPGFDGCSPWYMGTYGPLWDLHEGLNAQLGMSVTAGWGKYAPSGVGFGQNLNLAYALPLGKGFSMAAGLYVQNMDWGHLHQRDFGVSAVLGYQVNDIVSLYAYGTMSLMPKERAGSMLDNPFYLGQFRNRIGAMAEFKLGENAKISVSVERSAPSQNYGFDLHRTPDFHSPIPTK